MDTLPNGLPTTPLVPEPHQVTAASISRIFRHFSTESIDIGIAILTSDRGDRALYIDDKGRSVIDMKKNEELNKSMRQKLNSLLKSFGHRGWIRVWGAYPEDAPSEEIYEKRGDQLTLKVGKDVQEKSYLVPSVTLDGAKKLAAALGKNSKLNSKDVAVKVKNTKALESDFRQDAILWASNKAGAFLIFANGSVDKLGSKFEPNTLSRYFTQWHSKRFSFSSALRQLEYDPTNPSDYRQWRRELVEHCMAV